MYRRAFARIPTQPEVDQILNFIAEQAQRRADVEVWADVAHVLFNSAEFLYLR
jgi:hypothetical protein